MKGCGVELEPLVLVLQAMYVHAPGDRFFMWLISANCKHSAGFNIEEMNAQGSNSSLTKLRCIIVVETMSEQYCSAH